MIVNLTCGFECVMDSYFVDLMVSFEDKFNQMAWIGIRFNSKIKLKVLIIVCDTF